MGHHNHHFSGDAHAQSGIYGPPTSAANFCEEDYALTRLLAEPINALSSLSYTYLSLSLPGRYDALSISLCLVGVASAVYHATLLQTLQFGDDLSMLLLGAVLLARVYGHGKGNGNKKVVVNGIVGGLTAAVTAMYVRSGDVRMHTAAFTVMVLLIGVRTLFLIYGAEQNKGRSMGRFGKAVGWLVAGYVVWNVDLEMCHELRALRQRVGLPWAWLLELHGWWHVLTAVGAREYILLLREVAV